MKRALFMSCIAVLVAGCADIFGPHYSSHLGQIDTTFKPISVPDTVAANSDFTVSFYTSGGGCDRDGNTAVTMADARTAEIRGYDERQTNATACVTILSFYLHTATVRFAQTGGATVRVIGASADSTVTYSRVVVVR